MMRVRGYFAMMSQRQKETETKIISSLIQTQTASLIEVESNVNQSHHLEKQTNLLHKKTVMIMM